MKIKISANEWSGGLESNEEYWDSLSEEQIYDIMDRKRKEESDKHKELMVLQAKVKDLEYELKKSYIYTKRLIEYVKRKYWKGYKVEKV